MRDQVLPGVFDNGGLRDQVVVQDHVGVQDCFGLRDHVVM